jgi:transcription factor SFP1
LPTPKTAIHASFARKQDRDRDLYVGWHRRASPGAHGPSSLFLDSTLLDSDLADEQFPLFEHTPPLRSEAHMAEGSAPIDIVHPRQNSSSPRQPSNLTSALQTSGARDAVATAPMNIGRSGAAQSRKDSVSMSGLTPHSGAVPIAGGRTQPRRESMAGSMMNGMSWGGVSMNSWVRDE